jgi:hypothetical protein
VPDLIPFADITHLFQTFESSAFRLESRRAYAVDVGSPKWQLWRAGGNLGFNPEHPWHANVRAQVEQGKRFERVRVLDRPPTEGQQFLLASGQGNVEAGEVIRNLWRSEAEQLGLPAADFWLFDDRLVVHLAFDQDDNTLGVRVTEDQADVAEAVRVRDTAWPVAIPTGDFASRVPSEM